MSRRRNSIHVAIRLWDRCVFLRAAGFAFDESENVQNRGNTANVSRGTHESLFHAGCLFARVSIRSLTFLSRSISSRRSSKVAAIADSSAAEVAVPGAVVADSAPTSA